MLTDDILLRHARPGPRYTSYPTVPDSRDDPPDAWLADGLARVDGPVSVYVHVPFCKEQCSFCGCNMVVSGLQAVGDRYLDGLARQLDALPLARPRLPAIRVHLGGGTPTWLSPAQLDRLFSLLNRRFSVMTGAEVGVEVDPDVTTEAHVDALARCGVTRLSIGVQSFDADVLAAVNRPQPREKVARLVAWARARRMTGLNLDLMYGLPRQDLARFDATLREAIALGPDRLALFGYAHVPWLKAHQARIDADALPGPLERARMYLHAQRVLADAGFRAIGLDHFARADDALALADAAGTLRRDFMGYTDRPAAPLIGLGMSAISELPDRFVQQRSKLGHWYKAVERGAPLLERGLVLTDDDRLRAHVIERLMCALRVDYTDVEARFGIDPRERFAAEIRGLAPLRDDGLVEVSPSGISVPERARILLRLVAQAFDRYRDAPVTGPRFSQAV